jgi:hypothetical protein
LEGAGALEGGGTTEEAAALAAENELRFIEGSSSSAGKEKGERKVNNKLGTDRGLQRTEVEGRGGNTPSA